MVARYAHTQVIDLLLSKGVEIDASSKEDGTPLSAAARYAQTQVVDLLISRGAEVNAFDEDGLTPLHDAAKIRSY